MKETSKPTAKPPRRLNRFMSRSSRRYYQRAFLIYLGYAINMFIYTLYSLSMFKVFNLLMHMYQRHLGVELIYEQREILAGTFLVYVICSWVRLFAQGFDGDPFSHILYWRYRLINRTEMIARMLGGITAGLLSGLIQSRMVNLSAVRSSDLLRENLVDSAFEGYATNRTFTEILLHPLLALRVGTTTCSVPLLGNAKVLAVHMLRENTFINPYVAMLLDNFGFELGFSIVMYLAISFCLISNQSCCFIAIFVILKRCAVFSANAYLRHVHGVLCLDVSIAIRRYFQDCNFDLLIVRVLANLLAVIIGSQCFNTVKSLPYHDFKSVFKNLEASKMEAMNPDEDNTVHVCHWSVRDEDIKFSPFPDTVLGRLFHKLCEREKTE